MGDLRGVQMNSDFSIENAVRQYLPLMHELAFRIELVVKACEGNLNLPPIYAREYVYLQFRYMCELIALGCLQLHGDLPSLSKVQKEYNAEKIMAQLHYQCPHAFPQSVIRTQSGNSHHYECNAK